MKKSIVETIVVVGLIVLLIWLLSSCSSTRKVSDRSSSTVHKETDSAGSIQSANAADYFSNDQSTTTTTERATGEAVTNADSISVEIDTLPVIAQHGSIQIHTHFNPLTGKTMVKVHKAPEAVKVPVERVTVTRNDIKSGGKSVQVSTQTVKVGSTTDSTGTHKATEKVKKGMSFGFTLGIIFSAFIILLIIAYLIYCKYSNRLKQL